MDSKDMAKTVSRKLETIADSIKGGGDTVSKDDLIAALKDPWICIPTENGEWRFFNPETLEWGNEC